jgi:regulator of extracellular matrix RemA (YlzA/DUF370 family)
MNWILIDDQGLIPIERIVTVGQTESAPMRRLLDQVATEQIIILTGGRKRQAAIILDSGHIVLTALPVTTIQKLLEDDRMTR